MSNITDLNKTINDIKIKVSIQKYFDEIIIPELETYYSLYKVDFEARPVALCPLHDEDTPSFRYYDETNTFYCFGCRAGGDVINLHRKFMGQKNGEEISFIDAVKFIKEYFIDGKELAGEVKKLDSKQAKESLSTVPELLVYSNYIDRLEKKLMRADKMSMQNKILIYDLIDELNTLTSVDLVNATDAVRYLKNTERRLGSAINGNQVTT